LARYRKEERQKKMDKISEGLEEDAMDKHPSLRLELKKSQDKEADLFGAVVSSQTELQDDKTNHARTQKALERKCAEVRDLETRPVEKDNKRNHEDTLYVIRFVPIPGCYATFADHHVDRTSVASSVPMRRMKDEKVAHCMECFQNRIAKHCDNSSPCWPCHSRGFPCKRMKCKYFGADTCLNKQCALALSDDDYPPDSLVPQTSILQLDGPHPHVPPRPI
jgi:hypothetical protein